MNEIQLSKEQYDYLNHNNFFSQNTVNAKEIRGEKVIINISDENADLIRDALGEKLQEVGFDKSYNLTKEGSILEKLIDKFYI